ncbi:hypothetical protein [Rhizobium phaseoli]|uniref:hypothetical protein n=1 Tax=Rhizobium phaseoli TaxID=396 RepID=UPI0007EB77A3|nr:hypothetical protein [Rhizobium phaseoli]ANL34094.1 hypothetical protein AMC89_CH02034 [Rhizobium phaseoli]ANL97817.1 hypothetical protein AMC79_CH02027 [Rhizobium phaseoli]
MTIRERQEREAHDRENPWRPISSAPRGTGLICDLLFDDMVGHFAVEGLQFFLDADGVWYQIDPPRRVFSPSPINWRPSYVRMTPERRNLIKKRAGA